MADVLITVNGQPHTVAINGFEDMASDEQVRAMHYVATYLGATPATPAPAPAAQAAPAAPAPAPYEDSYFSDAQQGLHNAATGIGSTLDEGGKLAARNGATQVGPQVSDAGNYLKSAVPAVAGYQSPSSRLIQAAKEGRYLDAVKLLPHAAIEGGADLAGTLGSAVAGGVVGGPVGAAAGAVGYGVARNAGENAEARAANAGRSEPTTSDLLASAPGTAVEAGLGALGANKLPGVSSVVDNLGSRFARGAAKTALEGTGAAASSAAGDLAQGNDIDPYKAAVAATQGAAARAAGELPGALKAGTQATSDRILSGLQAEPKSTDAATADADAANLYQQFAAQAAQTKDSSPTAVLKSTRDALKSALQDYASNLKDKGLIDQGAKQNLATLIRQGGTHNNTIVEGPDTNFDALQDMGLSDEHLEVVQRGLRALDSLSDGSLLKNTTGPLQALGGAAARVGALGEAYQHAGPVGALVAAAGAGGHGLYDRVGQNLGRLGDQALGLSTPTILLRAAKAKRYLAAQGVVGPDETALQAVQRANAGIPDAAPAPIAPPSPADLQRGINRAAQAYTPETPAAPSPTPGFIRPDTTPSAPAPAPGFIRPAVAPPAPPQGGPVPPYIRPKVTAPDPEAAAVGIPDTETGLPGNPVPVDTPLRADGTPLAQAPNNRPAVKPLDVVKAVTDTPASTLVSQAMGAPPTPLPNGHTLATRYMAMGDTTTDPATYVAQAKAAEAAGVVPPGTADRMATTSYPIPPEHAKAIRGFVKEAAKVGIPGGSPVKNPIAYQAAVDQALASEAHVRSTKPHLGTLVNEIVGTGQEGKSAAARQAAFDAVDKSSLSPADVAALKSLTKFGKK